MNCRQYLEYPKSWLGFLKVRSTGSPASGAEFSPGISSSSTTSSEGQFLHHRGFFKALEEHSLDAGVVKTFLFACVAEFLREKQMVVYNRVIQLVPVSTEIVQGLPNRRTGGSAEERSTSCSYGAHATICHSSRWNVNEPLAWTFIFL